MNTKEEILTAYYNQTNNSIPYASTATIWKTAALLAMQEYAYQESERIAKEFAQYCCDFIANADDLTQEDTRNPILKTRQPEDYYYNYKIKQWAKDINEVYQQFKSQKQ